MKEYELEDTGVDECSLMSDDSILPQLIAWMQRKHKLNAWQMTFVTYNDTKIVSLEIEEGPELTAFLLKLPD